MNLSKIESANDKSDGDLDNGKLLRDIEAISKALYFPKTSTKALISPSQSEYIERIRSTDSKSKEDSGIHETVLHKNKKSSLIRNWKKPLKALAHIGHNRFNICFFLHVHSIDGLPVNFNDIRLCVLWKMKDEVLQTHQSKVVQDIAEFEETLKHECWVYGSRGRPHNSAKYEEKLSLISASVVEAPGVDIGKHWIDLTRLLPLTLEELEGENSSGKWTTSFKLAGKAEGATLNVSFGFSLIKDSFVQPKNNKNVFVTSNDNNMLRRVGSIPSSVYLRPALSSMSLDAKVYEEISPILGLELSKSIKFLYEKLNEANMQVPEEFDLSSEHVEPTNNQNLESSKDTSESESDNAEFVVIEQGIEMSEKEQLKLEQVVEIINLDEIIGDDNIAVDENVGFNPNEGNSAGCTDKVAVNDSQDKEITVSHIGSTMDELESAFSGLLISQVADFESALDGDEFLKQKNYMDIKSNYRASKMLEKSLSLDDATESVASEFLNMLGIEHASFGVSSDGDPSSPREHLLREFEKETMASGNFILGFDTEEDQGQSSCIAPTGSGSWCCFQDFDLFPDVHGSKDEHNSSDRLLENRRKANILEDLETESLMREWGLNERAFQSSPHFALMDLEVQWSSLLNIHLSYLRLEMALDLLFKQRGEVF
ncbi:protein PLASTID MOVEMENT IMPAIRED 1-RELATED 2-like [Mangifera indica]|uniref:protein PLASTID MOVEMENT IMPAIRED 1-RELATED 2-like n=1 Tax=Mangifera indica TaxID=29780 RepID=UPI001CFB71D2|nr:protein PLASTID MOVEMENT IMPAIRED 1-RELATED 2-like [Mangifera indica]XP_044464167.1 protein PLASTID MOVEMENT IMPAIRED 1-RELATED 2-like [Mangifera indica]XP_044464168.1 protein PLASTID MOVEMENT IMPAIRED 1-RELATED 2-like [Mangifera indica]